MQSYISPCPRLGLLHRWARSSRQGRRGASHLHLECVHFNVRRHEHIGEVVAIHSIMRRFELFALWQNGHTDLQVSLYTVELSGWISDGDPSTIDLSAAINRRPRMNGVTGTAPHTDCSAEACDRVSTPRDLVHSRHSSGRVHSCLSCHRLCNAAQLMPV